MVKGCDQFIAAYEETILDALTQRHDDESIEDEVCYTVTEVGFLGVGLVIGDRRAWMCRTRI
jgi:hypothetical protein